MTTGPAPRPTEDRPPWNVVLRAIREARGVTQEGWAAWLGVSEATVRRWESGTAVPNAEVEQTLVAHCEEKGLFRTYDQGPLRGQTLSPAWLRDLLAGGRLALSTKSPAAPPGVATPVPTGRADLPTGTVTLLFTETDIEESTPLTVRLGDRYPAVRAAQRDLLRAAFVAHGGQEVDTQGDSFFVAFSDAVAAVAAAIAAQRSLAAHPWPDGVTVRVRMGLHTGEPLRTAEGYTGLEVVRGARIRDAAHGGQVLLSARTAAAVQAGLAPTASLRDLGAQRLRGLPQPERVFQLTVADLPAAFPPLHVPSSLEAHFETVSRALTDGRLVLFLGTGVHLPERPAADAWQPGRGDRLPGDRELADHLAETFGYPPGEPRDLVRVAQYVAVTTGLGPLYDELRTLFDVDYAPRPVHRLIAGLPASLRAMGSPRPYQLIVTTTYDDVLERTFTDVGEPFDLVSYVAEGEQRGRFVHRSPDGETRLIERPNEYRGLALDERSVIVKIHGAIDRAGAEGDSVVITEDHYIDYLTRADVSSLLPVSLAAKLRRSHYLFLGYRLRDWNLRVILHRIWGQQKLAYKSWAIPADAHSLDQAFWRSRDVDVIELGLDAYAAELRERIAGQRAQAPESRAG